MSPTARPPIYSISLLTASTLCYEMLLMRLFSIIQWHHFAYMIIGLALLGYGVSGTFITMTQQWLVKRFSIAYPSFLTLFALSSLGMFCLGQRLPFNGEEILWNPIQLFYLFLLFAIMATPFFFAACAICLSFRRYDREIATIYAYDLAGAGAGSLLLPAMLMLLFAGQALLVVSICGLLAVVVGVWELRIRQRQTVTMVLLVMALLLAVVGSSVELKLSPYKSLPQYLRIQGSRIIAERSSPLGQITVMESPIVPLRHVPGMSFNAGREPLPQLGIFTDGDNLSVVTREAEDLTQLSYLDQTVAALPYHLNKPTSTLILGSGGGNDILLARLHEVQQIDAVELNPQIIDLLRGPLADFAGPLLEASGTKVHIADIRGYVQQTSEQYDLIQLALIDAFSPSASGLYALHENYLYTVEALQAYQDLLTPDGILAITRWIKNPPRDTVKLFATAINASDHKQQTNPANRLVLIRSWQASTLLIKNSDFTQRELVTVENFCRERGFDIGYHPAIQPQQVNRYNQLREPYFYRAAMALIDDQRQTFINSYKFNIEPATDNRPYFHHFFKWSSLMEILSLRRQGSIPLFETGYLILAATLVVSTITSLILILLPLVFFHKFQKPGGIQVSRVKVMLFFFITGLAFLFVEIAFIQRFILFLYHPVYAITVCLAAFLVFAGLGSRCSVPLADTFSPFRVLFTAVMAVALLSTFYLFSLDWIFTTTGNLPMPFKILITTLLIGPLAISMGMPFPLAMEQLSRRAEGYIPWAWGINGCASVISASLATLLAVHFGFTLVISMALCLYLSLLIVFPRLDRHEQEQR